jgi:hypothetical protein
MKNFYFKPDEYVVGKLCDSKGKCCIIGQFLRQECSWEKADLQKSNCDKRPYAMFQKLTDLDDRSTGQLFAVNDSDLPMNKKIKEFRDIFNLSPNYKLVVKKG